VGKSLQQETKMNETLQQRAWSAGIISWGTGTTKQLSILSRAWMNQLCNPCVRCYQGPRSRASSSSKPAEEEGLRDLASGLRSLHLVKTAV
jgi:hypothetical protein